MFYKKEAVAQRSSAMEPRDHYKNGASLKSQMSRTIGTNRTFISLSKVVFVFTLFLIFGCYKELDDENPNFSIREIIYSPPDLNDSSLQAKFAVKTQSQAMISYEYTGSKKDSVSCLFYYDKTENQGYYWVFSHNRMTQYKINTQNRFDNNVFEAEVTDSLIFFREYKYDWNNDIATIVGEYDFVNTQENIRLRSSTDDFYEFKFAQDRVKDILEIVKKIFKNWGRADKKNKDAINNSIKGINNAEEGIFNAKSKNPDVFTTGIIMNLFIITILDIK